MKALVIDTSDEPWEKPRGFTMADLEMPVLDEAANPADAASVIIKVHYAGVCGSDRGLWHRTAFKDPFNNSLAAEGKTTRIVGHEFVGEIVQAGSMVGSLYSDPDPLNYAKIAVGNIVSGDSHVTCGRCYQCRLGQNNVCMNEAILGITIDGVFTEYAKLPAKNLWSIDESRIRPEIAAIMDPFGNAVHCLAKTDVRGQRVAIFGAGPIGQFSILLAQKFGAAKVIVVDVDPKKLEMAKQLGADEVVQINTSKKKANVWEGDPEVQDRIMELTYGKGVDVALEMAGAFIATKKEAADYLRQASRTYLFSNALESGVAGAAMYVIDRLQKQPEIRKKLVSNTQLFREKMTEAGFDVAGGQHPITPIMFAQEQEAVGTASRLFDEGIYVVGFSYPVVPKGKARIRVQISAAHTDDDIIKLVDKFKAVTSS